MKSVLKWLGILAGTLAALILAAVAYVFVASERVVARTYDVPLTSFAASTDADAIRRGERLAAISGCNGCHGAQLQGAVMFDEPNIARFTAPNLTQLARQYSDSELERVIRHGVKPDGTSVWIMPSAMFRHFTDEDLAALVGYVRSLPERPGVGRERTLRTLGRIGIVTEKFTPVAAQAAVVVERGTPDYSDPLSHGRYLVMTACTECHGEKLQGSDFLHAPNLIVAGAYSDADFTRLMQTGVGLGDRDLGLMSEVAKSRFSNFSDTELQAIRTYLNEYVGTGGNSPP
jgi:mono/diheme cytochrome c family protein